MNELFVDFETRSCVDLTEVGSYNYCQHKSTSVLMLAWAFDDEEPSLWLPHKDSMPARLAAALTDPAIIKRAFNATFERNVLKFVLGIDVPWAQWRCVMVQARYLSLPGSLEEVCKILGLAEEESKIADGDRLKKLFCEPYILGGKETLFGISPPEFHDWEDKPEDWKLFEEYCKRDVIAERVLGKKMFPLPDQEQRAWILDQQINERGLPTSQRMRENCLALAQRSKEDLLGRIKTLTGAENPNSNAQILDWVMAHGYPYKSIEKSFVKLALADPLLDDDCAKVLKLRQEASKTSFKKLEALQHAVSPDGRLRDSFLFMGAARTARWSSHLFQSQNMPRPIKEVEKDYEKAISLILNNDYEGLKKYPSVIGAITSCLRSVFWATEEHELVMCDLSSIEPRVLGWVSGCRGLNEVFSQGRDPYLDFGTKLYHCTYEELKAAVEEGDVAAREQRQIAKPAVLGAGYGLGGGELKPDKYGNIVKGGLWGYAEKMGVKMSQSQAHEAVRVFRASYPEIADKRNGYWKKLERAATNVIKLGGTETVGVVSFDRKKRSTGQYILRIHLPSGRCLHYMNIRLQEEQYTDREGTQQFRDVIIYDGIGHGVGAIGKAQIWGPAKTYGGKMCLTGDTQVITNRGIIPLTSLRKRDMLWDGEQWVPHNGIIKKGLKKILEWKRLKATKDHQILAGAKWLKLEKMEGHAGRVSQLTGLVSGLRLLYSQNRETGVELDFNVTAHEFLKSQLVRSGADKFIHVPPALQAKVKIKDQIDSTRLFPTQKLDYLSLIAELESFIDAITPNQTPTKITAEEGSPCIQNGLLTHEPSSNTLLLSLDGMTRLWTWIESIMTETMNPAISVSCRERKMQIIAAVLSSLIIKAREFPTRFSERDLFPNGLKTLYTIIFGTEKLQNSASKLTEKLEVYDILNAGPRNRFTVLTEEGPLVVHNCENIVQAIARDVLLNAMFLADERGAKICGHFHDEILTEREKDDFDFDLNDLKWCMSQTPSWAPGLLIGAEGKTAEYYSKG